MIKISIIIATYNAAKSLRNCLESVVLQLFDQCELIIIDGGSKDGTVEIIKSFRDCISFFISESDNGIYDAWNKGVKIAKGEWIAFIGADDELLPGAIEAYLKIIETTPNIEKYDYICAHNEHVDSNGKLLKVIGEEPKWPIMRKRMAPAHVASLHNKKNLFESVGYYDYANFHICADYELLMRKKDKLKYIMIPDLIAKMEAGGMSFSSKAIIETYKIRKQHQSVSLLENMFLFVRDWVAFKFFIIRKTILGANIDK